MATIQQEVPKKPRSARRIVKDSRGPNWGRLVAEGRQARGAADAGRWRIGHLASLVAKQYGSGSLQQFADDIGETYSTVRRYRWVYKAYPDRVKWLGRAESGCWSVDQLGTEARGGVATPSKPRERRGARIRDAHEELRRYADLDDAEFAKASKWLEPLLDDLTESIDAVRGRLRKARRIRPAGARG